MTTSKPAASARAGQRADDVVRLDVGLRQHGETEERHGFLGDRDLHPQVVRHRRPVRLVALVEPGAERFLAGVEGDGDVRGREVAQQLVLHPQEAVRRVGGGAVGGRQAGADRVERAVQVRVAVHQQKSWHVRTIARGPGCEDEAGPDGRERRVRDAVPEVGAGKPGGDASGRLE